MMKKKITNFVLNKIHIFLAYREGSTIRASRLRKFKKKGRGLLFATKIVALWYLLILSGSYLIADTGAYFNDVETISNSLAAAENYCADKEWAEKHQQYCKDNSGKGNGCEAVDDCDSEKGEDEDNPGSNPDDCGDHTSAPCSEGGKVTNIKETHTSNSITLTWSNPTDNNFDSIKIFRDGESTPIAENIKNDQFEDTNLTPATNYKYKIVTIGKNKKDMATVAFEASTANEANNEPPPEEEKKPATEVGNPPPSEEEPPATEIDDNPPEEVTGANGSETGNSEKVEITWKNPAAKDFSHVNIYRDNNLVAENLKTITYLDQVSEKNHIYKMTTVDTSGNESPGVTVPVEWHK